MHATRKNTLVAAVMALAMLPGTWAHAHFLWLVPQQDNGSTVQLYFGEGPEPDNPKLLEKVAQAKLEAFVSDKAPSPLSLAFSADRSTLSAHYPGATAWRLHHTYGVFGRETKNLLKYTALSIPCGLPGMSSQDRVSLPKEGFTAQVMYQGGVLTIELEDDGKPAANVSLELQSPKDHRTLTTDAKGQATADGLSGGVYSIRVNKTDPTPGSHDGQEYAAVSHYTTISFRVPQSLRLTSTADASSQLAELPEPITSFGATTDGRNLYAYGGHTGSAHAYSNEEQFNKLVRLDLEGNRNWETLAEGPRVQGNALVYHDNCVFLLGGFSAENATGEKSRLVSQSKALRYDLKKGAWEQLPDLPEPRSSMDATVLGNTIYVIGGWTMNGVSSETKWLKTAWKLSLDPAKGSLEWTPIAPPPFERRAVAAVAHNGKVFVIGGMNSDGGPTTACEVYDPSSDSWSTVDSLAGVPLNGFGAAAAVVDGKLIASTEDGSIQQWNDASQVWDIVGVTDQGRFFHRIVPWAKKQGFVVLGGANMDVGKYSDCQVFVAKPE